MGLSLKQQIFIKEVIILSFASVGSCCDGLNSTYRAVVGRSKDLLGPYVDDKGGDMLQIILSWWLIRIMFGWVRGTTVF